MGSNSSKSAAGSSAGASAQSPPAAPTMADISPSDLASYLGTVEFDQDLREFDSSLHENTSRVFNSLGVPDADRPSLSVGTLREVTGSLIDVNQGVVRIILQCNKAIWDNKGLLSLVNEYFDYSFKTLEFFAALDLCLSRASDRHLILRVALLQFEEEARSLAAGGDNIATGSYTETLRELSNFKGAGDPFTEEFFSLFSSVHRQQVQMFQRLNHKKRKLDKKLKKVRVYRKVSNFIFAAAFIGVIICSAVAAALSAPHLLAALAGSVASAPIASVGTWFDKLWRKYVDDLTGQRDVIGAMHIGTFVALKDLDNIRVLVDRLEVQIESLMTNVDLAVQHEDAVALVIEEIKQKVDVYKEGIEELKEHVDRGRQDVSRARTVILRNIVKYPTTRN